MSKSAGKTKKNIEIASSQTTARIIFLNFNSQAEWRERMI